MKRKICIIIFSFTTFVQMFAQTDSVEIPRYEQIKNSDCSKIDLHFIGWMKDTFLVDYINRKLLNHPTQAIYLSDRNKIRNIKTLIATNDHVLLADTFNNNLLKLEILGGKVPISNMDNMLIDSIKGLGSWYQFLNGRTPYGLTYPEKEMDVIKSMEMSLGDDRIMVPDTAYTDLFYPSFNITYYSIKPIQLYVDSTNGCIYVYIFGYNPAIIERPDRQSVISFMAKLIFKDKKYIGRIVVDSSILNTYNWQCDCFIGF